MRTLTTMITLLLLAAGVADAQDSRGQIIGRVGDSNGAAIPGAEVKATNTATNVTLTGTTNEQGNYDEWLSAPDPFRAETNFLKIGTIATSHPK